MTVLRYRFEPATVLEIILWLPVAVVALGYVWARVSPVAWIMPVGILLAPLIRRSVFARPVIWEIASVGYLVLFWIDLLWISRHIGVALTHLVMFLILARGYVPSTPRIVAQRLGLCFAMWMLIGSLNNDAYFLAVSLLAIPAFIWALIAFQVLRSGEPDERIGRLWPWVMGTTGFVIVVGAVLFLLMPRYTLGWFYVQDPRLWSGGAQARYSENIDLDGVTRLKQDPSVAFHVMLEPSHPAPQTLYWRAHVLGDFDGRTWHVLPPVTDVLPVYHAGWLIPRQARPRHGRIWRQDVWVRVGHPTIVHLFQPISVQPIRRSRAILEFTIRPGYGFFSNARWYSVRSIELPHPDSPYVIQPDPNERVEWFLSLPERLSPAVPRLATTWTRGITDPIERARRITTIFRARFRYTTQSLPGDTPDPVQVFLTERRAGHCEYFATAMTLMLRSLGIPARVVVGFQGGEVLNLGGRNVIAVRNADAHAWVEVWDERRQVWVAMDPTPPDTGSFLAWHTWWQRLQQWRMEFALWWDQNVVLFSLTHQYRLAREIVQLFGDVREWLRAVSPGVLLIGAVGVMILGVGVWAGLRKIFYRMRRSGDGLRTGRRRVPETARAASRFLRWLYAQFGPRYPYETLYEYLNRVRPRVAPIWTEVRTAVQMLYRVRFGPPNWKDLQQFHAAVRICQTRWQQRLEGNRD